MTDLERTAAARATPEQLGRGQDVAGSHAPAHAAPAQLRWSALTSQSLYYLGRDELKHKILAVAEEEGVSEASYALKLLQSEGRLPWP